VNVAAKLEEGLAWPRWSGIIGNIGAAGGHVHCLPSGEVVITLPAGEAPVIPASIQTVFNGLAVSQMASTLPDSATRRQVQEVALRLAHHAIVELINATMS
jgi:hypothetical protein